MLIIVIIVQIVFTSSLCSQRIFDLHMLSVGIELDNVHESDQFYKVMLALELGSIIFSILLILACLLCTSERTRQLKRKIRNKNLVDFTKRRTNRIQNFSDISCSAQNTDTVSDSAVKEGVDETSNVSAETEFDNTEEFELSTMNVASTSYVIDVKPTPDAGGSSNKNSNHECFKEVMKSIFIM